MLWSAGNVYVAMQRDFNLASHTAAEYIIMNAFEEALYRGVQWCTRHSVIARSNSMLHLE